MDVKKDESLRVAGSSLRLIDSCITQHEAQGPSGICTESKEEEDAKGVRQVLGTRGGKACLLIRKHDHFTPAREIRRDIKALTNSPYELVTRYYPMKRHAF